MRNQGAALPQGAVNLRVVRANGTPWPGRQVSLREGLSYGSPAKGLPDEVNDWRERNLPKLTRDLMRTRMGLWLARKLHVPAMASQLWLSKITADGRRLDFGLAGVKVVTDAGADAIVDAFQNLVELELFNFHGIGTGSTAENVADTALVTELTTEYNPDSTRATGTQGEGAATNIYQTVGTNQVDAAVGIQEHGIFTQAATGGGTLLDRTVFAVINLGSGDSLESTYELTVNSGG